MIIVGTLLPQYENELCADREGWFGQPLHPEAADILDKRRLDRVFLSTFSDAERKAADRLSSQDPQLAEACADPHYNVTEFLAGAPTLVRRYENATQEQQAILHAATDAHRLGIHAPLTEQLLAAAARGYLTTVHPDDTWFRPALTELISDQHSHDHAVAPMIRVPNRDRSEVLGYTVTDYLWQRLTFARRDAPLSVVTWQALIDHTHDHADLFCLAKSAHLRQQYLFAETLYRRLSDAGNREATEWLARLLHSQDRVEEAIGLLRTRADVGDGHALVLLVGLLKKQDRSEEAIELLRTRADAGDRHALVLLVGLLEEHDRSEEAIGLLRTRAHADDRHAVDLLVEQGHIEEASELVWTRADADDGDIGITFRTARGSSRWMILHDGRVSRFGRWMTMHDRWVSRFGRWVSRFGRTDVDFRRVDLLAERGHTDEAIRLLRTHADAGDRDAAGELVELLADQGHTDELWAEVNAGTPGAAERLTGLLAGAGETGLAKANRMRRFGLNPDGSIADGDPGSHRL